MVDLLPNTIVICRLWGDSSAWIFARRRDAAHETRNWPVNWQKRYAEMIGFNRDTASRDSSDYSTERW